MYDSIVTVTEVSSLNLGHTSITSFPSEFTRFHIGFKSPFWIRFAVMKTSTK